MDRPLGVVRGLDPPTPVPFGQLPGARVAVVGPQGPAFGPRRDREPGLGQPAVILRPPRRSPSSSERRRRPAVLVVSPSAVAREQAGRSGEVDRGRARLAVAPRCAGSPGAGGRRARGRRGAADPPTWPWPAPRTAMSRIAATASATADQESTIASGRRRWSITMGRRRTQRNGVRKPPGSGHCGAPGSPGQSSPLREGSAGHDAAVGPPGHRRRAPRFGRRSLADLSTAPATRAALTTSDASSREPAARRVRRLGRQPATVSTG
jgi:hypothetical protein